MIFLYMDGGPSQVDTFDPKLRLTAENGKPFAMKMEPTQFNNNAARSVRRGNFSSMDRAAFLSAAFSGTSPSAWTTLQSCAR